MNFLFFRTKGENVTIKELNKKNDPRFSAPHPFLRSYNRRYPPPQPLHNPTHQSPLLSPPFNPWPPTPLLSHSNPPTDTSSMVLSQCPSRSFSTRLTSLAYLFGFSEPNKMLVHGLTMEAHLFRSTLLRPVKIHGHVSRLIAKRLHQ